MYASVCRQCPLKSRRPTGSPYRASTAAVGQLYPVSTDEVAKRKRCHAAEPLSIWSGRKRCAVVSTVRPSMSTLWIPGKSRRRLADLSWCPAASRPVRLSRGAVLRSNSARQCGSTKNLEASDRGVRTSVVANRPAAVLRGSEIDRRALQV